MVSDRAATGVQYLVTESLFTQPWELITVRHGISVCEGLFDVRGDQDYTHEMIVNHFSPFAQEYFAGRWEMVLIPWREWWP